MKKPYLKFVLLFLPLMFSTPSYADWTSIGNRVEQNNITTIYIESDRIRRNGDDVYFWTLHDYLNPIADDSLTKSWLSSITYRHGDCIKFSSKILSVSNFTEQMGQGGVTTYSYNDDDWQYPPPNSWGELVLKKVCDLSDKKNN